MALVYDAKYAYGTEIDAISNANDNSLTMPLSKTLRYFPILDKYERRMVFVGELGMAMAGSRYLEVLLNSIHTIANSFTMELRILQKRKYIEYIIKGMVSKYKSKKRLIESTMRRDYSGSIQNIMECFNIRLADTNLYKGDIILISFAEFDNYNAFIGFKTMISKNTSRYAFGKEMGNGDYISMIPPKAEIMPMHTMQYLNPKAYYVDGDRVDIIDYYGRYKGINPMGITLSIKYRYKKPYTI
nr:MAG TPA: hypothetical protein [Caudoviricetes sp.]